MQIMQITHATWQMGGKIDGRDKTQGERITRKRIEKIQEAVCQSRRYC